MTLQEIRVSGLLEQYVIGALDSEHELIVEESITENPQLLIDIEEIGNAIEQYSKLYLSEPSPLLKEQIINSLTSAPVATPTRRLGPNKASKPKSKKAQSSSNGIDILRYLGYGLAGLFLLSSIGLWMKSNTFQKDSVVEINKLKIEISKEKELNKKLTKEVEVLEELYDANNAIMHMIPERRYPLSRLYIVHVPNAQKKYVHADNLPELPANGRYQLWTVQSDGVVKSSAVIDISNEFLIPVEIEASQSLILSIESNPDVERPTRRSVIGTISL